MRTQPTLLVLGLLVGATACATPLANAGEKKETAKEVRIEGELTKADARDKIQQQSYHKVHTCKQAAGKIYRIDLIGLNKGFDAYLRLEDPSGTLLAEDDDGGGNLNSRIYHKAEKDGAYRLIATTAEPNQTGKYVLVIAEINPADIFKAEKQLVADLNKRFAAKKDKLTAEDVEAAMQTAQNLEFRAPALAAEAYTSFGKALASAADKKVAEFGRMLEGAGRRLNLPGKEFEIEGKTLDGKAINLKSYRGKVVLVDFWATWCLPCRAELPNIKKMYDTYRDKGFDVLGVSVDNKDEALAKFLASEKLPWKSLQD
jgi:thiol-disulfide isomerase/thioredoxin